MARLASASPRDTNEKAAPARKVRAPKGRFRPGPPGPPARSRSTLELAVPVSRIMQTNVWTIRSDALAVSAARIMREHRYGCLPVVDDGALVGILTEADLLTLVTDSLDLGRPSKPPSVEHAMTPTPTTITLDTSIADARSIMSRFGIRHLPVVHEDGKPLSMVGDRDLRVAESIFDSPERTSAAHVVHLIGSDPAPRVSPIAALHSVV